jgi:hypothetical protein
VSEVGRLVRVPRLTVEQCRILRGFLESGVFEGMDRNRKRSLRGLLASGSVQWVGVGRYRVTRLGRLALGFEGERKRVQDREATRRYRARRRLRMIEASR